MSDYFLLGLYLGAGVAGFLVALTAAAGVIYGLFTAAANVVLAVRARLDNRRARRAAATPPPFSDHHNHHLS